MRWLFNLILVLAPILSSYSIYSGLDLGSMAIAILVPLMYIQHPAYFKLPKYYWMFFIYVLFDSIVLLGNIPIRVILYSFILLGGCMFIDKRIFLIIYERSVAICSIFFIVQSLFQLIVGRNIPGIFSFLPTIYGDERDIVGLQMEAQRLSSFFLEPSYFAQYLFPYLCINLFANKTTRGVYKALFVSGILLLLRSGIGLVILAFIWLIWFFLIEKISNKVKWRVAILGIIPAIFVLTNSSILEYVMNRTAELSIADNAGGRYMSSGFQRFFNGYFVYDNLSPFNKLFGINPEDLRNTAYYSGSFLNGISSILIMEGLFGLVFFVPHLMRLCYRDSVITRVLVICIVFLLFSEAYFVSCRMQFSMLIAYAYSRQNRINV